MTQTTEPKRRGRPPLPADAPRSDKRHRSIRLGDDHWWRLKQLGMQWLERQIDAEGSVQKKGLRAKEGG